MKPKNPRRRTGQPGLPVQIVRKCTKPVQVLWDRLPKLHRRGLTIASAVMLIALVPWPNSSQETTEPVQTADTGMRSLNLPTAEPEPAERRSLFKPIEVAAAPLDVALVKGNWRAYVVVKGDTLSQILRKHGLAANQMTPLLQADAEELLSRLRPGQLLTLYISRDRQLIELQMKVDEKVSWRFVQFDDGTFEMADS